jgi:Rieske Fe-S protein
VLERPRPAARVVSPITFEEFLVTHPGVTRRNALAGAATVGLGAGLLTACGGSAAQTSSGSDSGASGVVAKTTEIPEGGGKIFSDARVVITQPTAGDFKAFSTTCTHQGCPVTKITQTIDCECHASKFSLVDGSVVSGPAPTPLETAAITVEGDSISLG